MSPSCCPSSNGSGNTTKANKETAQNECCEGADCGCNDACLDELAKAICASDDGHIHGDEKVEMDDDCKCDDATQVGDNLPTFEEKAEYIESTSTVVDTHIADKSPKIHRDECGVRKRKTTRVTPSKACGEHLSLARNRKKDTLAAFGCICRAMLARGLQSCCTTRATKGRFGTSVLESQASIHIRGEGQHVKSARSSLKSQSSFSGGSYAVQELRTNPRTLEIRTESRHSRPASTCCGDSCCGKPEGDGIDVEKDVLESDPLGSDSHVVLAIKGMTCTGCENKLIRTLRAQSTIHNIKTSLVLSRAEFDYAGAPEDIQALIQKIQKRTGFETERIASASSARALELTVPTGLASKLLQSAYPDGVQQVVKVNKCTVRVVYNPHVIGARDVLGYYETFSPTLAPEPPDPALTAGAKHIRMLLIRTITSSLLTIPVLVMAWAPLPDHDTAYAISSLVLASLVQIAIAGPFYGAAFKSLFFSGLVETDLLIVLSTTTAYIYSVVAFAYSMLDKPLDGGYFFETSTLLVTLIMFGQLASAFARQRAVAAISLRSLQQPTATLVRTYPDGHTEEQSIDVRLLQYDDTFRVHPDSVVITDGTILSGTSSVDESMMTGESLPVEKTIGDELVAGSTNSGGSLLVQVTRLPGENTISEIASMVDDARFSRARVQSIIDRVCAWFVPIVLLLAILTFVIWLAVGIKVRKQPAGTAAVKAITYAIAVLAVSCPCAIGLAVPMVVLVASGVAAQHGLVFKAATTIESAREATYVVFDKTGTLTAGRLAVDKADVYQESIGEISTTSAILTLVSASKHPVARTITAHLAQTGTLTTSLVHDIEEVTSKGIQAIVNGNVIRGGSAKWLELESHPSVSSVMVAGQTTFCITYDNTLLAVYALSDSLRPEAAEVITALRNRDIKVAILSGDHSGAVNTIARSLDIPTEHVHASCLPADKAAYIRELQSKGAKVLFCGDGTNDSVALAQADIGVHMSSEGSSTGSGAAASAASDAVLLRPSLTGVVSLLKLSDAVRRRIVLNFVWAAVYNTVAVLMAGGAFVGMRIAPAYAGLGEIVSVLPVVLIAMHLKWFKV